MPFRQRRLFIDGLGELGHGLRFAGQRRLGTVLLKEAERGVEQHDDGDDDGILEFADRAGQHGGAEQDDDQEVPELVEELAPGRARRLLGEAVGTVRGKALARVFRRQSKGGVRLDLAQDFDGRTCMPGNLGFKRHDGGDQNVSVAQTKPA